jgi:erythronate-4-phosphate dehydrogenase
MSVINVYADQHIPYLSEHLPSAFNVSLFNPDDGIPADAAQADALLIRTVTKLRSETFGRILAHGTLKFVGTASAGIDHVDVPFLEQNGVVFASATGCNAIAVAEYVASGLLHILHRQNIPASGLRVGVIGVGNAGSATANLLENIGFTVLRYDPPRTLREPAFQSCTVDEALQTDILTFHTPLYLPGEVADAFVTHHWMNAAKLQQTTARILVNASRGGVVDEAALLDSCKNGKLRHIIIDVWENEPHFSENLAILAHLATPHIAGYSEQSKRNATRMITNQLCAHFGIECRADAATSMASERTATSMASERTTTSMASERTATSMASERTGADLASDVKRPAECPENQWIRTSNWTTRPLDNILEHLHPMFNLSTALKSAANTPSSRSAAFRQLRTSGILRNEYASIPFPPEMESKFPVLRVLSTPHSNSEH